MRTIDKHLREQIAKDPATYARQVTGHELGSLNRHLAIASRLANGGKLVHDDLLFLGKLAIATGTKKEDFHRTVQQINSEPNPARRAELYAAGVGGSPEAVQSGMQMLRAYDTQRMVDDVNARTAERKTADLRHGETADPAWAKRYKQEASDAQSRRDAIMQSVQQQYGYIEPEKLSLPERQQLAQRKADSLADSLEATMHRPKSLRDEVASNVHTAAVLDELHDVGLRDESDTFTGVNERHDAAVAHASLRIQE